MTAISIYLHATDAENCANLLWKGPLVSPDAMVVVHHHSYSMHSSNGFLGYYSSKQLLLHSFRVLRQMNDDKYVCFLSISFTNC